VSTAVVKLPGLRLRSLNEVLKQHPKARRRQSREEKNAVGLMLLARLGVNPPKPPLVVTITRVSPGHCDLDNMAGGAKWCVDAIAFYLKIDDGSPLITWLYGQRVGPYAVEITIESEELPQ